jgi:hypothetical protein
LFQTSDDGISEIIYPHTIYSDHLVTANSCHKSENHNLPLRTLNGFLMTFDFGELAIKIIGGI